MTHRKDVSPDPNSVSADFFDHIATRYDRQFAPEPRASRQDLEQLVASLYLYGVQPGMTVLDLGSGTGRAWAPLLDAGFHVISVERSAEMIHIAQGRSSYAQVRHIQAELFANWAQLVSPVHAVIALHGVLAHPPLPFESSLQHVGRQLRAVLVGPAIAAIETVDPTWAREHLPAAGENLFVSAPSSDRQDAPLAYIPEISVFADLLGMEILDTTNALTGTRLIGRFRGTTEGEKQ